MVHETLGLILFWLSWTTRIVLYEYTHSEYKDSYFSITWKTIIKTIKAYTDSFNHIIL